MTRILAFVIILFAFFVSNAQNARMQHPFRQLLEDFPTPNNYRTAEGKPGKDYWQQRVDYDIKLTLDDENQAITGNEILTFYNNSPEPLDFIWIQLDQNKYEANSIDKLTESSTLSNSMSFSKFEALVKAFDGGFKISDVNNGSGSKLNYMINGTMMRVDLPKPIKPKSSTKIGISWKYNIANQVMYGGRSGYEFFKKDSNYIYEIAQFFPRACVYSDFEGWQNKQFIDSEFALPFGNYKVAITVPSDHVVAATGELQNASSILSKKQLIRLEGAKKSKDPILIIDQEEAIENEKEKATANKTWVFKATNVRDFAFASSRKFIWDAMGVEIGANKVLAMSFYPKEGNPLWEKYATHSVAHALKTYSKYTVDYPYPVCIAVHGSVFGMEYPMISFNGGRPKENGEYSERTKNIMISVIIHEVGHNFFPMIINSDERQWAWMDEGFNSFIEYLAEQEWTRDYPSRRGPIRKITTYMAGKESGMEPLMIQPDLIRQLGNNAYGKIATALNILRETVMGRELFDEAFKEYCKRWKFKHPTPYDFFRTMEEYSAVDLDWFWNGWFYNNKPVDITIYNATLYTIDKKDSNNIKLDHVFKDVSSIRNIKEIEATLLEQRPELKDKYDNLEQKEKDKIEAKKSNNSSYLKRLTSSDNDLLNFKGFLYNIQFYNKGGNVMPIILKCEFNDGSDTLITLPVEIWRKNQTIVRKSFILDKKVKQFQIDPYQQTGDINIKNNFYPPRIEEEVLNLYR